MSALPILKDYFGARRGTLPPLSSSDPDLLLDVDFTKGEAAVDAVLVTANGFSKTSGGTWDSVKGWNPGGVGYYVNPAWSAAVGNECSVYLEIERAAVSSSWQSNQSFFVQSHEGLAYGSAQTFDSSVFWARGLGVDQKFGTYLRYFSPTAVPARGTHFTVGMSGATIVGADWQANPNLSEYDDPDTMHILVTHQGGRQYIYVDDFLAQWDYDTATADAQHNRITIGAGDNGIKIGTYYIRRLQIINRPLGRPGVEGPRIAFIGDSYFSRGMAQVAPATPFSVATINAVQSAIGIEYGNATTGTNPTNPLFEQQTFHPWIAMLRKMAYREGLGFSLYNANNGGHGWSSTGQAKFDPAFFDAVVAYDPQIVVTAGSVNDVYAPYGQSSTLIADIKPQLDILIDGCKHLQKILFFQTFPGVQWALTPASGLGQPWVDEYHAQIEVLPQINGYRGVVEYHRPTASQQSLMESDPRQNAGSDPDAALWAAQFSTTVAAADSIHPKDWGMARMVEVIWPHLRRYIAQMPTVG